MWLLTIALAFAATEENLKYSSPQRSFEITLSKSHLTYRGAPAWQSIAITGCNRPLVDEFWRETVAAIKKLPKSKSPVRSEPTVVLNGATYWLMPLKKNTSREVRGLDQKFLALIVKEYKKCAKS